MKNLLKAKAVLRIAGIIALVAVFGFSMAACDDDSGGGYSGSLPAPTLSASISGTTINLSWSSVSGARGYKLYYRARSGGVSTDWDWEDMGLTTSYSENVAGSPGVTFDFKVAAYNSNRVEGDMSTTRSVTVGGSTPNTSLNGTWRRQSDGLVLIVNGTSATYSYFGSSPLYADAASKGYIQIGGQKWKSISSTGSLSWSGQELLVTYNNSNPNVAIGSGWNNFTITMSADGNTIYTYNSNNTTEPSSTYTRQY